MLNKALEKEFEQSAWDLWLTFDQEIKQKTPFPDFLTKIKQPELKNYDNRSDEEVLKDAEDILNMMKRT